MKKPLTYLIVLCFLFLFSGSAFGDDLIDGLNAYTRQDYKEAVKLFRLSAERGNTLAQYNLGVMYTQGLGVPQDDNKAVKWYRLAAEQGLAGAQSNLGLMYESGKGIMQDHKEAVRLYRQSAEQGNVLAQKYLGVMYVLGQGVPQDYVLAHMWFNLSGSNGLKDAVENRDIIEKRMTPQQIEKAQELARNWKPTSK